MYLIKECCIVDWEIFDLSDIMFFIKIYKSSHPGFNITDYITFATGILDLPLIKNWFKPGPWTMLPKTFQQITKNLDSSPGHYLSSQFHYNQAKITYSPVESLSIQLQSRH